MSRVRVIYVRKRVLLKGVSDRWLIRNNKLERYLNNDYEVDDESYKGIKENIDKYLRRLGESMRDMNIMVNFMREYEFMIKKDIMEYVKGLKEKRVNILHEGRYGTTLVCDNKVIKIQKILHINDLKKYLKEVFICYYVNKKMNLAPMIYDLNFKSLGRSERLYLMRQNEKIGNYLKDRNDYMCGNYTMEMVDYIFCDIFEPYKMKEIYGRRNKIVLENFVLGLRMCIGAIELLIDGGIHHNDIHDGNIGFTKEGKFKLIDFGLAMILLDLNKYKRKIINKSRYDFLLNEDIEMDVIAKKYLLYRELCYLREMYYKEDIEYLGDIYEDKKYSPVRNVLEQLRDNNYVFGSHKKYLNQKLDIQKVVNILKNI